MRKPAKLVSILFNLRSATLLTTHLSYGECFYHESFILLMQAANDNQDRQSLSLLNSHRCTSNEGLCAERKEERPH